jgi:CheY-like chemotaxis protein
MGDDKKFCICCNEDVSFNKIMRDGNLESICSYCGFVLEVIKPSDPDAAEDSLYEVARARKSQSAKSRRESAAEAKAPAEKTRSKTSKHPPAEKEEPSDESKAREEELEKKAQIAKELKERREALEKEEQEKRLALEQEEKERRAQLEKEVQERRAQLEREEKELRERLEREAREEQERLEREERERIKADCMIVADDSPRVRESLRNLLVKKNLSRSVILAETGADFMIAYSGRVSGENPVNLVILDLDLSVMDGLTTAHAMRSMEKKFGVTKKIPILFFSTKKSDEELRAEMKVLRPAVYLNKPESEDTATVDRIEKLVVQILKNPAWSDE